MHAGVFCGHDHLKVFDGLIPHLDVVPDGVFEHDDVLIHHGNRAGEDHVVQLLHGFSVEFDGSGPRFVQPRDQLGHGGFAAAAASHKGHL